MSLPESNKSRPPGGNAKRKKSTSAAADAVSADESKPSSGRAAKAKAPKSAKDAKPNQKAQASSGKAARGGSSSSGEKSKSARSRGESGNAAPKGKALANFFSAKNWHWLWVLCKALFLWLCIPFVMIAKFTRAWSWYVKWPMRLLISFSFVAVVLGGMLAFIYGYKSGRYDLGLVKKMPERTIVLDCKGREIGRMHGENRELVKLADVSMWLKKAIIAREDSRFYQHGGVDWIGVGRALFQVAKHKRATQGASTLTMQLVKNTYNERDQDLDRKLLEVALAYRIEASYDKDSILEAYLNRIFWGHGMLGVGAASYGYFNKHPRDLSLSEAAMLAGIVRGPNDHSPRKYPQNAKRERDVTLKQMLDNRQITQQQYTAALAEPLRIHDASSTEDYSGNYAMDSVRRYVNNILEEEEIQVGGLTVVTTLDLDLQNAAMEILEKQLSKWEKLPGWRHQTRAQYQKLLQQNPKAPEPHYLQGAIVSIDHSSGAVRVLVGGRDALESKFNRALQANRQVGSLFKPFIYARAFMRGVSAQDYVSDGAISPGELPGVRGWSPRNSDGQYGGNLPIAEGLIRSRNTMTVRVGYACGLDNVVGMGPLLNFNIPKRPASLLGSWETTPYNMASAYGVFANGGVKTGAHLIARISDSTGHVLYDQSVISYPVFNNQSSTAVTRMLEQVTKPGGTAYQVAKLGYTQPCGGKTGTTDNYTNAWFAGFNSDLTTCVWVGLDDNSKIMERGYGGTLAVPIWVDLMQAAAKSGYGGSAIRYQALRKDHSALVCRASGKLANSGCQHYKFAYIKYDSPNNLPRQCCDHHISREVELAANPEDAAPLPKPRVVDENSIPLSEPTQ